MRVLAMLVGVAVGLAGFAFAYIIIVFTMFAFQNTSPGYMAKTLPILLIITPLLGTIGGIFTYFRPLTGKALMIGSGIGWIAINAVLMYLLWHHPTKPAPGATEALPIAGFVSIPALASFLASWLASLAARKNASRANGPTRAV